MDKSKVARFLAQLVDAIGAVVVATVLQQLLLQLLLQL